MKSPPCRSEAEVKLRCRARETVAYWVEFANARALAESQMPMPAIRFDLRGHTAGMVVYTRHNIPNVSGLVRINAHLLWEHPDEILGQTLPHEVAHVVTRWRWGSRCRSHGKEWGSIMRAFGKPATRCHAMNTESARRTRRFPYHCAYEKPRYLGTVRHRRAQRGGQT